MRLSSALVTAIQEGDLDSVIKLIDETTIHSCDTLSRTPILIAIQNNRTDIATYLFNHPKFKIETDGVNALCFAAYYTNLTFMTLLLQKPYIVNKIDMPAIDEQTALSYAVTVKNTPKILLLLKYGADPTIAAVNKAVLNSSDSIKALIKNFTDYAKISKEPNPDIIKKRELERNISASYFSNGDEAEAFKWMSLASQSGSRTATWELANKHHYGKGTAQDLEQAVSLYKANYLQWAGSQKDQLEILDELTKITLKPISANTDGKEIKAIIQANIAILNIYLSPLQENKLNDIKKYLNNALTATHKLLNDASNGKYFSETIALLSKLHQPQSKTETLQFIVDLLSELLTHTATKDEALTSVIALCSKKLEEEKSAPKQLYDLAIKTSQTTDIKDANTRKQLAYLYAYRSTKQTDLKAQLTDSENAYLIDKNIQFLVNVINAKVNLKEAVNYDMLCDQLLALEKQNPNNNETSLSLAKKSQNDNLVLTLYKKGANISHPSINNRPPISNVFKDLMEYEKLKNESNLSETQKREKSIIESRIANAYSTYDKTESMKWLERSANAKSRSGMWYLGEELRNVNSKYKNIERAALLHTESYRLWDTQKDLTEIISALYDITKLPLNGDDDQINGILAANVGLINIFLSPLQELKLPEVKLCVENISKIYTSIPDFKSKHVTNLMTSLVQCYQQQTKPEIRQTVIELLFTLKNSQAIKREATEALITCCNKQIINEHNASTEIFDLAIKLYESLDELSPAHKKSLAELLLIRAENLSDKQQALHYYKHAYQLDQTIRTLFEITYLEQKLQLEDDANAHINELMKFPQEKNSKDTPMSLAISFNSPTIVLKLYKKGHTLSHDSIDFEMKKAEANLATLIVNLQSYEKLLKTITPLNPEQLKEKAKLENDIACEFYSHYDKNEAAIWYKKSAEGRNPNGMHTFADMLTSGVYAQKNLYEAVALYNSAYPGTQLSTVKNSILEKLNSIATLQLPDEKIKGDKQETPQHNTALAILYANTTLLHYYILNIHEHTRDDIIELFNKGLQAQTQCSNENKAVFTQRISMLTKAYQQQSQNSNVREIIIDLLLNLQKSKDLAKAATDALIDCCNNQISLENTAPKILLDVSINKYTSLETRDNKEEQQLAKLLRIRATQQTESKLALDDYLQAYKYEKSLKTLSDIIDTEHKITPYNDISALTNARCDEMIALAKEKPSDANTPLSLAIEKNSFVIALSLCKKDPTLIGHSSVSRALEKPKSKTQIAIEMLVSYNQLNALQSPTTEELNKKAGLANSIATSYLSIADFTENIKWSKISANLGNPYGISELAYRLQIGSGLPMNLEQSVILYQKAYATFKQQKPDTQLIFTKITNQLKKIAETSLTEEKNNIADSTPVSENAAEPIKLDNSNLKAILKANLAIANIYLDNFPQQKPDTIRKHLENALKAYSMIQQDNEKYFSATTTSLVKCYEQHSNSELRQLIIDQLTLFQKHPQLKLEASQALLACCNKQIFDEKQIQKPVLEIAIQSYDMISNLNNSDELKLASILKLHAKESKNDSEQMLKDYTRAYALDKNIKTLLEVATTEQELKRESEANAHCKEALNHITSKPLTKKSIGLINDTFKITTDNSIKTTIDQHRRKFELDKLQRELQPLTKHTDANSIEQLMKMAEDTKDDDKKNMLTNLIELWIKNSVSHLIDNKIVTHFHPFHVIINKALVLDKNIHAKEIYTKLKEALSVDNWYAKCHLANIYFCVITLLNKDIHNKEAISEANQLMEKILFLIEDILRNNNGNDNSNNGLRDSLIAATKTISTTASHLKNRVLAQAIIIRETNQNYQNSSGTTVNLARSNYLPAIFQLAEKHRYNRTIAGEKPHVRRALSLYLKASLLVAGLTSEEAAKIFMIDADKIQYWRETALQFMKSVASNTNNYYQDYAAWASRFINLLLVQETNLLNAGIDPDAFILTALNNWDDITAKHKDMHELPINPTEIKKAYLAGLHQAFEGKWGHYHEEKMTYGVIPSQVVQLLSAVPLSTSQQISTTSKTTQDIKQAASFAKQNIKVSPYMQPLTVKPISDTVTRIQPPAVNPFMAPDAPQLKTVQTSTARMYPTLTLPSSITAQSLQHLISFHSLEDPASMQSQHEGQTSPALPQLAIPGVPSRVPTPVTVLASAPIQTPKPETVHAFPIPASSPVNQQAAASDSKPLNSAEVEDHTLMNALAGMDVPKNKLSVPEDAADKKTSVIKPRAMVLG